MSWFTLKPHEKCTEAIKKVEEWWADVGEQSDLFYEIDLGRLRIFLFGNYDIGCKEYQKRHNAQIPSLSGCMWAQGAETRNLYEIWLPMKLTKAGKNILNEWGAGHELMHVIDHYLGKRGIPFGDPDDAVKEEFYG